MEFQKKDRYGIEDLLHIMELLRSEGGCPWDREQTHESIRKNLIEETYETVEAIDQQDAGLLREELGDVLLQVVFHARMEEEKGVFSFDDVANDICRKLIIRHPHIFGDATVSGVDEVLDNWNAIKQQTKGQTTAAETLTAVPRPLPALMRAEKVQSRAGKANPIFGYLSPEEAMKDLRSEEKELEEAAAEGRLPEIADEIGDLIFAAVNVARKYGLDPEELLTRSTDRFIDRFTRVEALAGEQDVPIGEADTALLDRLWRESKEYLGGGEEH